MASVSGILIRGRLVHYESIGRGRPVVLLHGWLGSWRYWVPVMDELSTDRRAYALDLWGFGDSDKGSEPYDIDTYVDQCMMFMDELGIAQAPFVGHTLGAAVAVRLAARWPGCVEKIMAVGLPLSAAAINRKLLVSGPNDALARLFWHRQKPHEAVQLGAAKTARNAISLTIQSVARLDALQALEGLHTPLLAVYGERDRVIHPGQADELEASGDRVEARAIVLPGASHFPMLDVTPQFTRLVRDWLDIASAPELGKLTIKEEWRRRTH